MNWDRFSEIYDWEFELLNHNQKQEICFWMDMVAQFGDPILEIACGSGRITLPIIKKNYRVTAIDISAKMINLLKRKSKNYNNLILKQADMRNFSVAGKFPLAIITYASFQQLLTKKDQIECLMNIHKHLLPDGIVIIDTHYMICEEPDTLELTKLYDAFNSELNAHVTMFTSYSTDKINRIRHWEDKYILNYTFKSKEIENAISLKEISPDDMKELADITGFKIEKIYGNFNKEPLNNNSDKIIFILKKSAGN